MIHATLPALLPACRHTTTSERFAHTLIKLKDIPTLCAETTKRGKIGLVLSGGGARGLAHLGVLGVLEEHNIPIDLIAGTSIGGIIAGYLASGYSSSALIEKMKEFNSFYDKSNARLRKHLDQKRIEEFFQFHEIYRKRFEKNIIISSQCSYWHIKACTDCINRE